jgi:hypothetical protein
MSVRATKGPALALLLGVGVMGWLVGCSTQGPPEPAIGTAFAGPATVTLRKDLAAKAPAVATVEHGEKLDIVEKRRRFYRVRTTKGITGWTDGSQLMSEKAMQDFRRTSDLASQLPSQGTAKVFDPLNVHIEPARQSPSFYRIPENGSVEVIGHRVAPRQQEFPLPPVRPAAPPKLPPKKKTPKTVSMRPPMPAPPKLPENWLELSKPMKTSEPNPALAEAPKAAPLFTVKRAVEDDWALVRTPDGRAGWALFSRLYLAIPDEVAQYAEGHRITAYASLGEVRDGDAVHHNWIWGTLSKTLQPYQFDSFRVFIWSKSRHRYETAYIERNVKGYYPLTVEPSRAGQPARFSVITEGKEGRLVKRTFEFSGYRASLVSTEPYQKPGEGFTLTTSVEPAVTTPPSTPEGSWLGRARQSLTRLLGL